MDARARIEPRGRDDERVHKGPLDAVIRRRFVPLVDDPHRRKQHPRPEVEFRLHLEVQVRLFQLHLARFLGAFDEAVLELELPGEAQPLAEAMGEEQDKTVKIELRILLFGSVEVKIHVA